jgi:glucose-6-phosphate dehydrogenase assembly protein OpcA
MAGWLASRLGWTLATKQRAAENEETLSFKLLRTESADRGSSPTVREGAGGSEITLQLNRVAREKHKPGRLVEVELRTSGTHPASFSVKRSADNLHILAEANVGTDIHRGRLLPVRNRSLAHLLSREMEILSNDNLYQQALSWAATLIEPSN